MDGTLEFLKTEPTDRFEYEVTDNSMLDSEHSYSDITQLLPGYPDWQPPTLRFGDLTFTPHADLGLSRGAFGPPVADPAGADAAGSDPQSEDTEDLLAGIAATDGSPIYASGNSADADSTKADIRSDAETLEDKLRWLHTLSDLANAGDQSAREQIQLILLSDEKLWRCLNDAEAATEAMLVEYLAGTALNKEAVRCQVADLKRSLASSNPTPLEKLAAGRVVACWLFAQFIERWCGFAIKGSGRTAGLAKLLESSEKRLQVAFNSLKLVREMR